MKSFNRMKALFSRMERIDIIVNNNVVRQSYNDLFLRSTEKGIQTEMYPEGELIISLTSYGNKLHSLYLTIESLLHQTVKPNRILLWLDEKSYINDNSIPLTLHKQKERGLEIRLCEDIRSYTKLVPTLMNYPDAIVISVDDDIIYPIDFVERLYRHYQKDTSKVYFYRGHYMLFDSDGSPRPYSEWVAHGAEGCNILNVPTGVSGILYPPHCYHNDIFNKDLFLKICPYADDIWFKVMTYLNGTLCEKIDTFNYDKLFIPLDIEENTSLQSINVVHGGNDKQIKQVLEYYNIKGK